MGSEPERSWLTAAPLICVECGGEQDAQNLCRNNFHWTGGRRHEPIGHDEDGTPFDCRICGLAWPCPAFSSGRNVLHRPQDVSNGFRAGWEAAAETASRSFAVREEMLIGELNDLREKCALVMIERDGALAELAALRQQIMVLVNGMHCEHGYPAQGMGCEHDPSLTGEF